MDFFVGCHFEACKEFRKLIRAEQELRSLGPVSILTLCFGERFVDEQAAGGEEFADSFAERSVEIAENEDGSEALLPKGKAAFAL